MDISTALMILTAVVTYLIWLSFISRSMKGPRVWPLLGSLPGLIWHSSRMHDWIADNLRKCGGTYQTCVVAIPLVARKQSLVTVTCDPKNLEHILKARFDNYPKGPNWQSVFHDLLGDGIFNSDGETWLFQRKTAALEFTTRTLRQAMARWDPQTLSLEFPENGFAVSFDTATEATLQRFILPEIVWKLRKSLRLGMEMSLTQSLEHIDAYLSDIINTRKLELVNQQKGGNENPHDDLLSSGAFVPAGSSITYSIYAIGRMEFIWGDDCLEFKPERWLSLDGKKIEVPDSYRFVAFNAGPRICLGKDLAYLQMKSIAAALLLRHRISVVPGHRVEQKMSLTLFMKYGLMVNVHPRDLGPILERVRKNALTNSNHACGIESTTPVS
ncbi:hypothetical protein D5086_006995 [Populus alba]|uniref:Uncharacterized protein n=1 Tax=Populus alba TaxID=43335 RepID=A0ACC4CN77_POPAL